MLQESPLALSSPIIRQLSTLESTVASVTAFAREGKMPNGFLSLEEQADLLQRQQQALTALASRHIQPFQDVSVARFLLDRAGLPVMTFGDAYSWDRPGAGLDIGTRYARVAALTQDRPRVKDSNGKNSTEVLLVDGEKPSLLLRVIDHAMYYPIGKTEPDRYRNAITRAYPYLPEEAWKFDAAPVGKQGNLSATKELTAEDLVNNHPLFGKFLEGSKQIFKIAEEAVKTVTLSTDKASQIEAFIAQISPRPALEARS